MLSVDQLQRLLVINRLLTIRALRARDFTRVHELGVHRIVVKDCLIEQLTKRLQDIAA